MLIFVLFLIMPIFLNNLIFFAFFLFLISLFISIFPFMLLLLLWLLAILMFFMLLILFLFFLLLLPNTAFIPPLENYFAGDFVPIVESVSHLQTGSHKETVSFYRCHFKGLGHFACNNFIVNFGHMVPQHRHFPVGVGWEDEIELIAATDLKADWLLFLRHW